MGPRRFNWSKEDETLDSKINKLLQDESLSDDLKNLLKETLLIIKKEKYGSNSFTSSYIP